MPREQIKEGALVRLKSGTEGWVKGQVVEYFDVLPMAGGYIYGGGLAPGYKVHILEGKHKDETIRVPENYVEPYKTGREPLYPHVPGKREPLFPHVPKGRGEQLPATKKVGSFIIAHDYMGNLIITHTERTGEIFLQLESDRQTVYDILKKWELKEVEKGWSVQIKDTEPRASILAELWEISAQDQRLPQTIELLASTEGDPLRKFCCRICGECTPKELLEEGRFPDRIAWLRHHYKEKHPGMWGKMSPMTVEDGEPVSPEYRHLASLVREPLPKEAE